MKSSLRSFRLWQKAYEIHDAVENEKKDDCGQDRLKREDTDECKERYNNSDLNGVKRLHNANGAAIGSGADATNEPRLIRVASSNNRHEPELTS